MIESKAQLHKKLVSLQQELDMYKSHAHYQFQSQITNNSNNQINEYFDARQLEINDYSNIINNRPVISL